MMLLLYLFALGLAAVPPSDGQELKQQRNSNCPKFWFGFNGRCYIYVATSMTWADAEQHCVNQGANLVSIHSLEEENFVKRLIRNIAQVDNIYWIGLSDIHKDGTYFWSDGSRFNFSFWNAGEPNNNGGSEPCVHSNVGSAKGWNDTLCRLKYSFVCKARPAC
ncbi:lactose-binding lectin l-2-like [Poecilia latipinna]|uniref:Lactose-binding lectin l-2-like n=1 Tax=Poecilia latipinna TaxID=48699 RepID=A0A3B3TN06_9TELE|nr:PREDICTED: lactose-binding lectin l-2-like [Poecilia latipinna]